MTIGSRSGPRGILVLAVVGMVTALVGWPLFELARIASEYVAAAVVPGVVVLNTVVVGTAVAVFAVSLGTAAAFITERASVAGRHWLRLGVLLPILVPPFVSALSWLRAYGPSGLVDDTIGVALPGLLGPVGVVLVIGVNAVPLVYVLVAAALRSHAGRELELAGRVSGAGRWAVARTVTLPLLAPALIGAGALTFVVGINAFGVPAVLGTPGGFGTVTTRIYQELALSARPQAFGRAIVLAAGLVLLATIFVLVAETSLSQVGKGRRTAVFSGGEYVRGKGRIGLAVGAWVTIALTTILPLVALLLVSITRGVGVPPIPANWTGAHFREALDSRLMGALIRSVGLAVTAATLAVVLGSAISALRRGTFGRLAGAAVLLTFAVPGSTLAVAILLGYGWLLRDTLAIILLAYVAKLWAVGHRVIAGSADNLAADLLHAARSSGASAVAAIRTITVPLLRPALVGAWILVALIAFHEVTMSALLYGPGTDTLAVAILNLQQLGDVPVSSALAVILTVPPLILALPLLLTGRLSHRPLSPD